MTLVRRCLAIALILCFCAQAWASIASDASSAEGWLDLGKTAYGKAEFDKAIVAFQKALELDPHNASALYAQGLILAKKKQWADARDSFRSAVQADPSNPKAWLGWGWMAEKTGDSAQAILCYQRVLQLNPETQDQIIAQKRLTLLGAPLPNPATAPAAANTVVATKQWKEVNLSLGMEGGNDDNLNASSPSTKFDKPPLEDGYTGLAAHFGASTGPAGDQRLKADAAYQYKNYFTQTGFNNHDLTGKAAWEAPLAPSLRGNAGLGGGLFLQNDGLTYYSGKGWAQLEFMEGSAKVSATYNYSLEYFNVAFNSDYDAPIVGPGQGSHYVDPTGGSHRVDISARERLLPWMTLNAQYRFKDNQANGLLYDYVANSVGGGAEFFLFSSDQLAAGLQIDYLKTSRQYRDQTSLLDLGLSLGYPPGPLDVTQQDNLDLWTIQGDLDFQDGWSASLYYRYENNSSNISAFSYADHLFGASLTYDLI